MYTYEVYVEGLIGLGGVVSGVNWFFLSNAVDGQRAQKRVNLRGYIECILNVTNCIISPRTK